MGFQHPFLTMFLTMFTYAMLKAFQQRNVAFDNYWWILPTSWAMAGADVFIIVSVAKSEWSFGLIFWYGTGGALGAILAMLFHKRFVKR